MPLETGSSCHASWNHSLILLCPELLCAVIKELLVHLHEQLQGIVDQAMDGPVQKKGGKFILFIHL